MCACSVATPPSRVLILLLLFQESTHVFKNTDFGIYPSFLVVAVGVLGCCHLLHFTWQCKSQWGRFLLFFTVLLYLYLCFYYITSFFKNKFCLLLFPWTSQIYFLWILWQFYKWLSFGYEYMFWLLNLLLSLEHYEFCLFYSLICWVPVTISTFSLL